MSELCILICRRDDPSNSAFTELASFALPTPDVSTLQPATTLDDLEATTLTTGMTILRRLLQLAWEQLDAALVAQYRAQHPNRALPADGSEPLTIVSRFGTLPLRRQVLADRAQHTHVVPGNAVLPAHGGVVTTRGLQEWACLLPQELPFSSVARLLGWQTQEPDLLSQTTVRTLVKRHGQLLRQAEQEESAALLERPVEAHLQPVLAPRERPRRRAGWPVALNAAVEAALAREQRRPPEGVSWADWERVLEARRAEREAPVEDLRHLGPRLAEDEVLLSVDEVLTPKTDGTGRWELRTAVLATAQGERYLSGTGAAFLPVVQALARVAVGQEGRLLLLSDGARWIRTFFAASLSTLPGAQHLLDWYHLEQKCRDQASRICRDKEAQGRLLRRVYRRLWGGQVAAAVAWLEGYRPQARNTAALDELIGYLQARAAWIPNYRQRRRERQYIGSGHAEKANDRLVARRQKRRGMHWSLASSDSLAALRTLVLNGGWDAYWAERRVVPLVAEAA
jgi:hypothetical protein